MKDLRNIIADNKWVAEKTVANPVKQERKGYTASIKLQTLVNNNQLTEEQEDALTELNVYQADDAMALFKDMLGAKDNGDFSETDIISTLYHLLDFEANDYVICEGYGGSAKLLDMDTLQDILDY